MIPAIVGILTVAIPGVVQLIEKLRGPKTGPQKFDDVSAIALALLEILKQRGLLQGATNDDAVRGAVESIVQQLKAGGTLASNTPADPGTYLLQVRKV